MQCKAEQRKAKQSRAKHSLSTDALREASVDNEFCVLLCFALLCFALLCFRQLSTGALREAPVDNECFALLCSVLPTSKAKRSGLRQFLRGYPRFALLCLANLEGQAKWAKAIFEGVPRLRHPGLGTLATSNPGR